MELFLTSTLSVVIMLGAWSLLLYKENPWSRWVEYTTISLGAAYGVIVSMANFESEAIIPILEGDILLIVPVLLGLVAFLGMYVRTYRWTLRWPLAVIAGVGFAVSIQAVPGAQFLVILQSLAIPVSGGLFDILGGIVMVISTISILVYFTYSREHKGILGIFPRIGKFIMLIAFGVEFGFGFLGRFGNHIQGLEPILAWLGLIPPV